MAPSARWEIFSKRGLKHRATKERGYREDARKRLPDPYEVDMMNPISFFVEVHFLNYFVGQGQRFWERCGSEG